MRDLITISFCVFCAILCTLLCYTEERNADTAKSVTASDDQTALQQALFLVELLKSEHARVLRNSNAFRVDHAIKDKESSTSHKTRGEIDQSDTSEHNFHGGRRFQDEDIFGAHPHDKNSSTVSSSLKDIDLLNTNVSTTTTVTANIPSSSPVDSPTETVIKSISKSRETKPINSIAPYKSENLTNTLTNQKLDKTTVMHITKQNIKLKLLQSSKLIPNTLEPHLSQVAEELEKELVLGLNLASRITPPLWRGTTKIYLAGSTRYPIPLPENHAFCYTNPKSTLCRTFI